MDGCGSVGVPRAVDRRYASSKGGGHGIQVVCVCRGSSGVSVRIQDILAVRVEGEEQLHVVLDRVVELRNGRYLNLGERSRSSKRFRTRISRGSTANLMIGLPFKNDAEQAYL